METYKYLEDNYLTSLLNGYVYLNSFSNIRHLEERKITELIGDTNEGLGINKADCLFISPELPDNDKIIENLRKAGGSNIGKGCHAIIINGTYIRQCNDAWMFCTTSERNDDYWINQSGYSKCVKIIDIFTFFERCAIELEKSFKMRSSYGYCKYEDVYGKVDNGNIKQPNYYRKSKLFCPQKEHRFVFEPFLEDSKKVLNPITIKIKTDDIFILLK